MRRILTGWMLFGLAACMSAAIGADTSPRVLVMPALREGTANSIAAAEAASRAVLDELVRAGQIEVMPYDPTHPSVERAIAEGKLTPADLAKTVSADDMARILRALDVDYAVDPRIFAMQRDPVTGEAKVELRVTVHDLAHSKPRIIDCEASVTEKSGEFDATLADRAGRAAGQLAAAKIIQMIQSVESSGLGEGVEPSASIYERANQAMVSGDTERAIELFVELLRREPKNVEYRLALAAAYEAKGQHRSAWLEYRRVTELKYDNDLAWAGRGRTLLSLGDSENAVNTLNEALKLGVDSPDIRLTLGEAYLAEDLVVQAEAELARIEDQAATDLDAALKLGRVYESTNKTKKALTLYTKFADNEANVKDPRIEFAIARVQSARGDFGEALTHLRKMAQLDEGTCKVATSIDYQVVARSVDGLAKEISIGTDTAFSKYDNDQMTRIELHEALAGYRRQAQEMADLLEICKAPAFVGEAQGRRRHAAGLLVQSFFSYMKFSENDDAAGKDYGDLLKGEAMNEFALAQKTG